MYVCMVYCMHIGIRSILTEGGNTYMGIVKWFVEALILFLMVRAVINLGTKSRLNKAELVHGVYINKNGRIVGFDK